MPNDTPTLRLGIGAIFKNECPYILEWIAYHRVLGFSRFFIADNNSDDGSTALLASLAAAGVVEHIPFPGQPDKAPQLPAYTEILRRHGNEVDWLAFIDADEFFLPTDGSQSMLPFVAEMNAATQIGLVAINWATYGSSHQMDAADEPVIERFSQRATRDYIHNHHYKSLVRTSANPTVRGSPHLFSIKPGAKTVQTNGAALVNHAKRGEGLSAEVVWDHVRLNHFIVKSRQEFFEKKGPKGRATVVGQIKGEDYFTSHDRNEETDPTPQWLIKATKAELSRLNRLLTVNGLSGKTASTPPGQRPLVGKMGSIAARLRNSLSTPPRQVPQISRGSIDRISISESQRVSVAGWALLPDKRAAPLLSIKVGEQVVDGLEISRRSRPDVVRHFPGADPLSGFSISFPLNKLREPKAVATVTLLAGSKTAGDPVANSPWPVEAVVSNATNGKIGIIAPDKKTGGPEVLTISKHLLRPTDLTEKSSISDVVSEPNSYFLAEESETVTASQPDVRNISGHAIQPTDPVFMPLADDNLFPAITRCPPVFVSHLKDAICHGDGIITQDNLVFSETFRSGVGRGHTKLTPSHLSLHSEGSTLPVIEEPTLYLDGEHFAGFGHFLGEVFSRLWIRKHIDIDQLKVAVGKGAWLPHVAELLECAGVKAHQLIELTQPTKFRSLIVASQSHVVRTGLSRLGTELYGDIADSIDPIVASTHVYLSRRLEKRRALVNEPDVERTFRQLGFDIVIPELLTMRAQISLFRHARYLAGPSGSNFFGLLFARQVNAAFVLTPSAYILHNEVVLASRSKTRLSYLVSHSEGILDNWVVEKGPLTDAVNHWLHKQIQNDNTGALSPNAPELRRARGVTEPSNSTLSASTTPAPMAEPRPVSPVTASPPVQRAVEPSPQLEPDRLEMTRNGDGPTWYPPNLAVDSKGSAGSQEFIMEVFRETDSFVYAELGIYEGATAEAVAEHFPNAELHLFDFDDSIEKARKRLARFGDRVHFYANSQRYSDSYNWHLHKLIAQRDDFRFDYCFLDGAHTYAIDALSFFLCDILLSPGGYLYFDDYEWRLRGSSLDPLKVPAIADQYTDEQIDAFQVKMIVDDLVRPLARYSEVVENKAFQKTGEPRHNNEPKEQMNTTSTPVVPDGPEMPQAERDRLNA